MEFQYITNPQTGRKVNVNTRLGKQIVNNYLSLQSGGADGCRFNPSTKRCSKTGTTNPRWCMKGSESGRCKKSPAGLKKAPKSTRSAGKPKSGPASLPKNVHEVTISKLTLDQARLLAAIVNDEENGPFVILNMAGANLEGPVAVEEGNRVVFRVRITDSNYDVDYVMEQLLDGDNVAQGPLQDAWDSTVGRHNLSIRS